MPEGFTLAGYQTMLGALIARGYQVHGYEDADPRQPHLILRHDLDMSLGAAQPVAEIERSLGAKSHFFVLVRAEMYNVFSAAAVRIIHQLQNLGHEIGLHLDASFYGDAVDRIENGARIECDVLEQATGKPVRIISFHRPAKSLLGQPGLLAGRRHAYQPRFFSEMGYCSDSRGDWHHGHPLEQPAVREKRALQLLTHPVWWVSADASAVVAKVDRFLGERIDFLRHEVAANCEPYRDALAAVAKE